MVASYTLAAGYRRRTGRSLTLFAKKHLPFQSLGGQRLARAARPRPPRFARWLRQYSSGPDRPIVAAGAWGLEFEVSLACHAVVSTKAESLAFEF
jgi:hypothetical protein